MLKQPEIRALTGLRGVAACLVMLYHFMPEAVGPGPAGVFLRHGYLAVDLFFVLSGFVMAMTYAGDFRLGFRPGAYGRFLLKRLGRVYPLYVATTLLCALGFYAGLGAPPSGAALAGNLLMVQGWGIAESLNGPGWSISTEFAAYLLFPLLTAGVLFGGWRMAGLAAGLSLAALLWIAGLPDAALLSAGRYGPLDVYDPGTLYPVLRCLAGFTLGLVAWRLASLPRLRPLAESPRLGTALALAALLLLALRGSDVLAVLLFVPLIIALATGRSAAARLLEAAPVHWLGTISYSIYLVHRPVIDFLRPPLRSLLEGWQVPHAYSAANLVLLPLALALAALTFYAIEKPGRQLSRMLANRRPPAWPEGPMALREG